MCFILHHKNMQQMNIKELKNNRSSNPIVLVGDEFKQLEDEDFDLEEEESTKFADDIA